MNLVFKFNWDHQPLPYNSAQGKRQFMLPFASGIPNLVPDWTQVQGLGNAATKNIGEAAGNVLQVGAFGLGGFSTEISNPFKNLATAELRKTRFLYFTDVSEVSSGMGSALSLPTLGAYTNNYLIGSNNGDLYHGVSTSIQVDPSSRNTRYGKILSGNNTTIDANGFVKAASPVVKLFQNHIELNNDAAKQSLEYEKLGIGNYLLKGTLGFAKEGWYIEVSKDANGNNIVAVEYTTLKNGDLSIKTYKRKFDFELAAIVADHENPVDIPEGRWIDIRLHEEPEVISDTPLDFQPTNLSRAVSAALEGIEPPEVTDKNL